MNSDEQPEGTPEQGYSEEIQHALSSAREAVRHRYKGFPFEPEIYIVEACGLQVVCLPMTLTQRDTWMRKIASYSAAEKLTKSSWELVREVIYHVQGQATEEGNTVARQAAAFKYLKALAEMGGQFSIIADKVSDAYTAELDNVGGTAKAKKL